MQVTQSAADSGKDQEGDGEGASLPDRLAMKAAAGEVMAHLKRLAEQPPCVVLLGESNSGKTTLANRLIGNGVLPTRVVSNTRFPILVRHAPTIKMTAVTTDGRRWALAGAGDFHDQDFALVEIGLPDPRLKTFEILDTPCKFRLRHGRENGAVSPLRIPIWCTSATQAWKESERRTWLEYDRRQRRHALLVVTRLDLIKTIEQRDQLFMRLRAEAGDCFDQMIGVPDPSGAVAPIEEIVIKLAQRLHEHRQRTAKRLTNRITRLLERMEDRASVSPPV